MKVEWKELASKVFAAAGYVGMWAALIWGFFAIINQQTCTTEILYADKQEVLNSEVAFSESYISQEGTNGSEKVCKKGDKVVSREVIMAATPEVRQVGTKETPAVIPRYTVPTSGYRTGAICNNGSYSSATGRGACSWNGGVREWLYE